VRRRLAGGGVILAAGNGTALWYLTRASGVVALLLLTAGLVLGILGTIRWRSERWPRFAVVSIHRNLTLFAVVFVALHVLTTIADGYAPVGLKDTILPFLSRYRPLWVGFGTLTFDLLLALIVTSLLRARIGYPAWRAVHWLAYASWPFALLHGLGTGSDARFSWLRIVAILCILPVGASAAVRLQRTAAPPALRAGLGAAGLALGVFGLAWYHTGPGKRGWAVRAGTPSYILRRHASTASLTAATVSKTLPKSFDGQLTGRLARSGDAAGDVGVAFGAAVRGRAPAVLRLTLWGTATGEEGVAMSDSSVTFAPSGLAGYSGKVVGLEGNQVVADLTSASGARLRLTIVLNLIAGASTFSGSVHGDTSAEGE
jgi:Ferric reductase like transmembrane component